MVTSDERNQQLTIIYNQIKELRQQGEARKEVILATVTCPCGRCRGITHAVRCLYCKIWYCETCAEEHFGQTREEYRAKNLVEQVDS